MSKRESIHYVNNAEFSHAVVEYVKTVNSARDNDKPIPIVPDYIAECFLRISEGLSHKSNFIRYTYREEMVMDAVENCLKAILNYNIETATRTGKPNAFAYFTQISWYAFLRRIAKEKKQQDIKIKFLTSASIEDFIETDENNPDAGYQEMNTMVDVLRDRIEKVRTQDSQIKEFAKQEKKRKKRTVHADSDLTEFLE